MKTWHLSRKYILPDRRFNMHTCCFSSVISVCFIVNLQHVYSVFRLFRSFKQRNKHIQGSCSHNQSHPIRAVWPAQNLGLESQSWWWISELSPSGEWGTCQTLKTCVKLFILQLEYSNLSCWFSDLFGFCFPLISSTSHSSASHLPLDIC